MTSEGRSFGEITSRTQRCRFWRTEPLKGAEKARKGRCRSRRHEPSGLGICFFSVFSVLFPRLSAVPLGRRTTPLIVCAARRVGERRRKGEAPAGSRGPRAA